RFSASLPEVAVEYRVGILPTEALKRLGENEAQLRAEVSRAIGNIETRINALGGRFDDSMGKIEGLGQRLGDVEAAGPTPLERLQGWTQRHYVLFGEGSNFRFPKQTDRDLREAAELFKTTPADVHVRIIGYTDPTGSTKINNSLSYARANAVLEALASFGVARDRLIAVGRSTEKRLSPLDGEDSLNRRVEFEIFIFGKATNDAL
ncbi:MAG: OmpA family protein, partial [Rhodospirillales bacterium]|nr:OmpA family protein [Rhodospirillales bacterium]